MLDRGGGEAKGGRDLNFKWGDQGKKKKVGGYIPKWGGKGGKEKG